MPSQPYILEGTVIDENSIAVASVKVVAHNTTKNNYLSTRTDADGKYLIDLSNADYSTGDTIIVKVSDGRYFGEATITVTGSEGQTVNISVNSITGDTVRDKAWIALYNHLQTGTYAISTDTIHSAMSDDLVKSHGYPIVIIEPASTSNVKLMMNRDGIKERPITFNIMVYENTVIKGPAVIGKNCKIKNAYIGPYTSIGSNCVIENTEIEDSIIMDGSYISCSGRIVESLIGKEVKIMERNQHPIGRKLVLGDRSQVIL